MIPYSCHNINQTDIDAVAAVLRSDYLTQNPAVPIFEQSVANYCGAQHTLAVSRASAALHIACLSPDIGLEDWLWTTPITFVASTTSDQNKVIHALKEVLA